MIKNYRIIIPFNAAWQDGCDYAQQTIQLLAESNQVLAVPMAHEQTIWQCYVLFRNTGSVIERHQVTQIFTPIAFLPLRRFSVIKNINLIINILFLKVFLLDQLFSEKTGKKTAVRGQLIWFFEPQHIMYWLKLLGIRWKSVYDCVDFWPGFLGEIGRQHAILLRHATWVVVNSQALFASVSKNRPDVVRVPLGFATQIFGRNIKSLPQQVGFDRKPLVFGFVGQVGNRFDFDWLERLVMAFPQHRFVFVGAVWAWLELEHADMQKRLDWLRSQPNCIFKPAVPKAKIPRVIADFDFGLIPYNTKELFNRNCHPLKLYEYWYLGKPVVATAITELLQHQHMLIATNDAAVAILRVKQYIHSGYPLKKRIALRDLALANSWREKLEAIAQVIDSGDSFLESRPVQMHE